MMIAALFTIAFAVAFALLRIEHRESIERMPPAADLEARSEITRRLYERMKRQGRAK